MVKPTVLITVAATCLKCNTIIAYDQHEISTAESFQVLLSGNVCPNCQQKILSRRKK